MNQTEIALRWWKMEIIGIILIIGFIISVISSEQSDKEMRKKAKEEKYKKKQDAINREYETQREKNTKEREERKTKLEISEKAKECYFSRLMSVTTEKFNSPHYLQLIEKLQNRYPLVEFVNFFNNNILERFIRKYYPDENYGIVVDKIFRDMAKFCYECFNKTWDKIVPLSSTNLENPQYFEQIDLPENWDELRQKCYIRDKGSCKRCGLKLSKSDFQVHHIISRTNGGGHDLSNLVTICIDCHSLQGGMHKELRRSDMDIDKYLREIMNI